jgi:hypothetical protein
VVIETKDLPSEDLSTAVASPGFGTPMTIKEGQSQFGLCPFISDVNLFRYGEGIVDFNGKIPDGALDLRMSQQQLYGT